MVISEACKRVEDSLPKGWDSKNLGEIATITSGGTPSRKVPAYWDGDVPWVTTAEIGFSTIVTTEQRITQSGLANSAAKLLHPGTLLLALYGQGKTRGKVSILGIEAATNQACASIVLNSPVSRDYVFQFLSSKYEEIRALSNSGGQENLSGAIVKSIRIDLPDSKDEQRSIAAALSDVDELIAKLAELISKKRGIMEGAMQHLLSGEQRLPGFTGKWEEKRLGDIGEITGAGVDKKSRENETPVRLVNFLDVLNRNFIRGPELTHYVTARQDQIDRCAVRKGDIFFTPSSEMPFDIGVSAVAIEDIDDAVYSYHVVRLRLAEDWDLRFRAYAFRTQYFLKQAETLCEGSGKRYVLNLKTFRELLYVRYPKDRNEQAAISSVLSDIDDEIALLERERDKSQAIKQGMMKSLLTGKIRLL